MPQHAYYEFWPLDVRFADIPFEHELRIRGIGVDDHALRIEYQIRPALPKGQRPAWDWDAHDERGAIYRSVGGAYGASADGETTDGVFSLRPFPPPARHTLYLRVTLEATDGRLIRTCRFEASIDVPPGL